MVISPTIEMLGSMRPEQISIAKERLDYTLIEDIFSKLATDDEYSRAAVIQEISEDIIRRGRSDLQSVKIFLGTILRLAYQSPFNDIATGMSELLKNLEEIGLQIPRIRFKNGPSLYIPQSEVPKLSDTTSEAYEIFKDAFMNDARVSHMVQVMGFHPSYTVEWVRAHHYLLRGNGVLPRHIRAYVAILASARHNCLYTVNLFEREFLCFGGNPDWLNGVDRAPLKYQRLNKVNNILCHKAWSLTHTDIEELSTGTDRWTRTELTHAITIMCHTHALTTFVLGCGLNSEIDSCAGHSYGVSPQVEGEEDMLGSPDKDGSPLLFDDIYTKLLNHGDGSETVAQETINQQIFDSLITFSQEEHHSGKPRSNVLAHYITDPEAKYEACPRKVCGYEIDWDDMGNNCCRNFDDHLVGILNQKFNVIQRLTYRTMGDKKDVDTTKLRDAVWYYVHSLCGIYYDHVDYSVVQALLPEGFRNYIFHATCSPELLRADFFNNWNIKRGFTYSEKVHFCLIIMEARFQAEYCFALRSIN